MGITDAFLIGNPTAKNSGIQPADVQAGFWLAPITRREAQKVFDDQSEVIRRMVVAIYGDDTTTPPSPGLLQVILKLDAMVSFLLAKLNVTPEEFQTWVAEQSKEGAKANGK
jgi:hypothetical protein